MMAAATAIAIMRNWNRLSSAVKRAMVDSMARTNASVCPTMASTSTLTRDRSSAAAAGADQVGRRRCQAVSIAAKRSRPGWLHGTDSGRCGAPRSMSRSVRSTSSTSCCTCAGSRPPCQVLTRRQACMRSRPASFTAAAPPSSWRVTHIVRPMDNSASSNIDSAMSTNLVDSWRGQAWAGVGMGVAQKAAGALSASGGRTVHAPGPIVLWNDGWLTWRKVCVCHGRMAQAHRARHSRLQAVPIGKARPTAPHSTVNRSIPIQPTRPSGGRPPPPAPVMRWRWATLLLSPHRLAFAGACAVLLLSALWWLWVQASRLGWLPAGPLAVSPSLGHGVVMVHGFMPLFFTGFLFTAGPKWLGVPGPDAQAVLPAVALQALAWPLWLAGIHLSGGLAIAALLLAATGQALATLRFVRLLRASAAEDTVHARVIAIGWAVGTLTLAG